MEFLILLVIGFGIYYLISKNIKEEREEREGERKQERIDSAREQRDKLKQQEAEKLAENIAMIRAAILPHSRALAVKYNQMIYKDDYGNFILDEWIRETDYFIENVLLKDNAIRVFLSGGRGSYKLTPSFNIVNKLVFDVASEAHIRMNGDASGEYVEIDELTGEEFELYCVSILNKCGWDAKNTKSTGDQGIDIIGRINGITAVFQCKRYSQPVGNSAVQEVIAGKTFAKAQVAAVVTNSTFTKSARQLAQAANIFLLHHTELEEFSEMIFSEE